MIALNNKAFRGAHLNRLFAELKRRNVFRVAGVYAVVGWLLIQVTVAVLPTFDAPRWVTQSIIAVVFLGFPIALVFAWAFEMTPEGVKRTSAVAEGESITEKTGKRLDMVLIGMFALLVAVIIGDRLIPGGKPGNNAVLADASIAVLPFADMSPDKDQEYFADGISEELLNVLAQVQGLEVAGRTSSFAFKGQNTDLREIAQILDVAHVLEGSVRKSGNRIRVTAQLIRADNGFQMWSDTYDGDLTDIFAVQDEIANAILAELKPQLLGEVPLLEAPRTDISAYDFYLIAQQKAATGTMGGYQEAADALDKALAIDPDYVPALAWRAYYELMMSDTYGAAGNKPAELARENAAGWVNRALELDADSADALFAKAGLLSMSYDQANRGQAEQLYQRALEAKPNFAAARNDYGFWLFEEQRFDEAIEQFEIALAHDPAQVDANVNLAHNFTLKSDYEKLNALFERWARISPDDPLMTSLMGGVEALQGNLSEAVVIQQKLFESTPDDPYTERQLRDTQIILGITDEALKSGDAQTRYFALTFLGRKDDALDLARTELGKRPDFPPIRSMYLHAHFVSHDWDEVVRYYDETWDSPDAFMQSFSAQPFTSTVPPLLEAGHPDAEAMLTIWRQTIDEQRNAGINVQTLDANEGAWHLANGEPDKAFLWLEEAVKKGSRDPYILINPTLGNSPRANALREKIGDAINAERAKLGLKPVEMPKPFD